MEKKIVADSRPGDFEFFVKMRLLPTSQEMPALPLRLKPVFCDPSLADVVEDEEDDDDDDSVTDDNETALKKVVGVIKDPFKSSSNEADSSDSANRDKLGRNMRASKTAVNPNLVQSIHKLRSLRMKLLHQQRDQLASVESEMVTDETAASLVNGLLQKGFSVQPPANASQPKPFQLPFSEGSENEPGNVESFMIPVEKERMFVAVHRERGLLNGNVSSA